jgi:hypothetical protein
MPTDPWSVVLAVLGGSAVFGALLVLRVRLQVRTSRTGDRSVCLLLELIAKRTHDAGVAERTEDDDGEAEAP